MKFNLGDKVKIITVHPTEDAHCNDGLEGKVGTIVELDKQFIPGWNAHTIRINGIPYEFYAVKLELIKKEN
jgi:hypothetical protein